MLIIAAMYAHSDTVEKLLQLELFYTEKCNIHELFSDQKRESQLEENLHFQAVKDCYYSAIPIQTNSPPSFFG
jgi:hypothetical protein